MKSKFLQLIGIIVWVIYAISALGITYINPDHLTSLNVTIRTVVSVILMIRFRPAWMHNESVVFTKDDWEFVFGAAFYLFTTTTLNSLIQAWFKKMVSRIEKDIKDINA